MNDTFDRTLDTCGLNCPEPVMMLHNEIRKASPGEVILLTATDPSTLRDIPKFCQFLGHELVDSGRNGYYYYYIRKL